ncbi:hypothetical protein Tco_1236291 [Tanacetum coccineum]
MSNTGGFLVSDGVFSLFPHVSAICLDRNLSDHRPILLREVCVDYGPTPFRFYHSWFELQGFDLFITQTWEDIQLDDKNDLVRFKKKLQTLKKAIRVWVNTQKSSQSASVHELKSKLNLIDSKIDKGDVNADLLVTRMSIMKQLQETNYLESRDHFQKAKIHWAVEGDENSKFFHGIVNKKRANLAVKGVMVDGDWVDDPIRVKEEFHDYFATRFCETEPSSGYIDFNFPNKISGDQLADIESPISNDEIRRAVWGCGENKSPGPDGFSFEFFRKFWHVVEGCLLSSKAYWVLVNGSPTKEFQFFRGLKQGDPLAPFLFILVMESLHLSFSRLIDAGVYSQKFLITVFVRVSGRLLGLSGLRSLLLNRREVLEFPAITPLIEVF